MKFAVISDLHYGAPEKQVGRPIEAFVRMAETARDLDFLVVTGDLTDHGYDGQMTCRCLFPCLGANSVLTGGGETNELGLLREGFVNPIDRAGVPLHLLCGNHDLYNGASRAPVRSFVRRRNKGEYYVREVQGVHCFFLGVHPGRVQRAWMRAVFRGIRRTAPILLFFHYNLAGPHSDAWKQRDKDALRALLSERENVLGIFVGHVHASEESVWHGFRVFTTAGSAYAIAEVDTAGSPTLRVQFVK